MTPIPPPKWERAYSTEDKSGDPNYLGKLVMGTDGIYTFELDDKGIANSIAEGDKIDLTKIDANLLKTGLDAFTFIGSESFTGAGQLRFDNEILSGNINGNLAADFEIHLVGVTSFTANDLAA